MASYEKFNYLLRPAKQVERKLLIEALHQLAAAGFRWRRYRYVGFGSPFYADFALFHKYLYIDDGICVERSDIRRRMDFNRPFPHIKLHMGEVADLIPRLDRRRKHVVWLDYDYPLDQSVLGDLSGCASVLPAESVLIVTVEADTRIATDLPPQIRGQVAAYRRGVLEREIGQAVQGGIKPAHMSQKKLAALCAKVMLDRLHDDLALRSLKFIQLFNFSYADGRQMLSVGGVIGDASTEARVRQSEVYQLPFVTDEDKPLVIGVPPLTARERLWLDQNPKSKKSKRPFELHPKAVADYRRYARHYPIYFESLL